MNYYAALAKRARGPVLEYGCGNGRITLAIAHAGVPVVGIDLSATMLADLRRCLRNEPHDLQRRVTLVRGDMRTVRLKRRFPLVICPFNAFLHLYTRRDVERFLEKVHQHLEPRGELVLDVSIPEPSELARKPTRAYRTPPFRYPMPDHPTGGPIVNYSERFDYDKVRQVLFVAMEFFPKDGSHRWMTPLAHRQFHPSELEAILHYNGLRIRKTLGDFKGPADASSTTLVVHCAKKR